MSPRQRSGYIRRLLRTGRRSALAAGAVLLLVLALPDRGRGETRPGAFSFVHISDIHIPTYLFAIGLPLDEAGLLRMPNAQRLRRLVDECLARRPRPALVMNSGDTVDVGWRPFLALYGKLLQPLVAAGIPVFTVVGNHDLDYTGIAAADLAEHYDPLGPAAVGRGGDRYSFDYEGRHFVILNNRPVTGLIRLTPDDHAWLERDLRAVPKDSLLLVFLHAEMPPEDTFRVVERLQDFGRAVIFRGHAHAEAVERWGAVPVVVTGALYGGTPAAGSYRLVTVDDGGITVQTRDFAEPEIRAGPGRRVEFLKSGPRLVLKPLKVRGAGTGTLSIEAETRPPGPGIMDYAIPGALEWTRMSGGEGRWSARATPPGLPGYYLLTARFTGDDGSVSLAHSVFRTLRGEVREIWSRDLGDSVQGAPSIGGGLAVVPTRRAGIWAIRLDDGRTAWRARSEDGQIGGRVVNDGQSVYYGAGRTVWARRLETGEARWRAELGGSLVAGLTLAAGRLYVPAGDNRLHCLDTGTGRVVWSYSLDLPIMMEPAADGRRVYFGAVDGCVRALDSATGAESWKVRVSTLADDYRTAPFWPPVLAGDRLVIGKRSASGEAAELIGLLAATGGRAWSARISGPALRTVAGLDGKTIFAPGEGGVCCLSAQDGTRIWEVDSKVRMSAGIAVDKFVLVRDDYDLACLEAASGETLWTFRTATGPQGTYYGPGAFAVRGRLAVVGTMDGRIMSLGW